MAFVGGNWNADTDSRTEKIKQIEFIKKTQEILFILLQNAQSNNPSKEQIVQEVEKFSKLVQESKKDGIHNVIVVLDQERVVEETINLIKKLFPELIDLE